MTMIATVAMLVIMPDFLSFRYLEEVLVANASQELSILEVQLAPLLSALNTPVLEAVQVPNLKSQLGRTPLHALRKVQKLLVDTMVLLTALIL